MGVVKTNGLIFDVSSDKAILMGLDKTVNIDKNKELQVPTQVEGKPVTEIAAGAFFQCSIKQWCLPATIGTIGSRAFGSSAVEKITFYATSAYPYKGTVYLGDRVFKRCKSLKTFSTMQKIAASELAFCSCNNLTTELYRHEMRFVKLERGALAGCSKLEEIFVATGATLADGAFQDSKIRKIHFDKNIFLNQSVLDFIKTENVEIVTSSKSEIADLAYEGLNIEIVEEN